MDNIGYSYFSKCSLHTEYSSDCTVSIDEVVAISKRKGLDGVAISDHNSIEGVLRLKEMSGDHFLIIVGEEVNTIPFAFLEDQGLNLML